MKKLKFKLLSSILLIIVLSCDKKYELKSIIVTNKNEYWQYKDICGSSSLFFKFNENGSYDRYNRFINEGFVLFNDDGDLVSKKRTWDIKNDSIFVLDNEDYKIEKFSTEQIILSYYHYKQKNKICKITLKKVHQNP